MSISQHNKYKMKRRKEMNEKRQLSEAEKQKILAQHGRKCFVDGEPIPDNVILLQFASVTIVQLVQ
jgi:hypothetical protein